jgi:hypothetical protein
VTRITAFMNAALAATFSLPRHLATNAPMRAAVADESASLHSK